MKRGLSLEILRLEIAFTRAAPAFDNLFMGCVFNINTVHKTVEKLTFQALYCSKFVNEGVITSARLNLTLRSQSKNITVE